MILGRALHECTGLFFLTFYSVSSPFVNSKRSPQIWLTLLSHILWRGIVVSLLPCWSEPY